VRCCRFQTATLYDLVIRSVTSSTGYDNITDNITIISFDSETLKQIDQVTIPPPAGLTSMGGPYAWCTSRTGTPWRL